MSRFPGVHVRTAEIHVILLIVMGFLVFLVSTRSRFFVVSGLFFSCVFRFRREAVFSFFFFPPYYRYLPDSVLLGSIWFVSVFRMSTMISLDVSAHMAMRRLCYTYDLALQAFFLCFIFDYKLSLFFSCVRQKGVFFCAFFLKPTYLGTNYLKLVCVFSSSEWVNHAAEKARRSCGNARVTLNVRDNFFF